MLRLRAELKSTCPWNGILETLRLCKRDFQIAFNSLVCREFSYRPADRAVRGRNSRSGHRMRSRNNEGYEHEG